MSKKYPWVGVVYICAWDHVVKIGATHQRRWRHWEIRGAETLLLLEDDDPYTLEEVVRDALAPVLGPTPFRSSDDMLTPDFAVGAGYLEFHVIKDRARLLRMVEVMRRGNAN